MPLSHGWDPHRGVVTGVGWKVSWSKKRNEGKEHDAMERYVHTGFLFVELKRHGAGILKASIASS